MMTEPVQPASPASAESPAPENPQPAPSTEVSTEVLAKEDKYAEDLWGSARSFEERQLAFTLASTVRQATMVRRAAEAMARYTEWGAKAHPMLRAALARYALECGTDPMRHWYILGNSFYDRAELYIDALAADPEFVRPEITLIHKDERADAEEASKRLKLRVKWGAPEESPGIAVVKLFFNNGRGPFEGCNWVKVGVTSNGKQKDPVGSEHPTQTAITRAYRKAGKQCQPVWFMKHVLPVLKKAKALQEAATIPVEGIETSKMPAEEPHPVKLADPTAKAPAVEVKSGKAPDAVPVREREPGEEDDEPELQL